ncbi:MAG: hypothetical protein ACFFDI_03380 [Promethearchaeota archaeon]
MGKKENFIMAHHKPCLGQTTNHSVVNTFYSFARGLVDVPPEKVIHTILK